MYFFLNSSRKLQQIRSFTVSSWQHNANAATGKRVNAGLVAAPPRVPINNFCARAPHRCQHTFISRCFLFLATPSPPSVWLPPLLAVRHPIFPLCCHFLPMLPFFPYVAIPFLLDPFFFINN
jgi:hypothetical protein